jgi:ADP-ribosyl-[dinitrogen reductase] hydrolase
VLPRQSTRRSRPPAAPNHPRPLATPLASDPGVILGNVHAAPIVDTDVIVSLCRMGSSPPRPDRRHIDVLLTDDDAPDANPNLGFILRDTADTIAAWRWEGETVFLHRVRGQSRTPSVGAACLTRRFGRRAEAALAEVRAALRVRPWSGAFLRALRPMPSIASGHDPGPQQS